MYIGLIPMAMAVGSLFSRKKRPFTLIIIAILAITLLAVALRLPGFEVINHLPILGNVNNTRLKWYFSFLAAILAGFGLDVFGSALASPSDIRRQMLYPFTIVFTAALIIFSFVAWSKYKHWQCIN